MVEPRNPEMACRPMIGLIPAGGKGTRIAPLPMSKELYPIGFQHLQDSAEQVQPGARPKVVAQYLLERFLQAGVTQAFFILRPGKWDIPAYFGDGSRLGLALAYLTVHVSYGVPYTLDQAYPFVNQSLIAFGFPDIVFQPEDAFTQLVARQARTQAEVVLGLFPTAQPQKVGVVEFDEAGWVHRIVEKPQESSLRYMWAIALWTPTFTQFLHDYLRTLEADEVRKRELPIGDVIQAAIAAGLPVQAKAFPNGQYLDIGTPEDLRRAIQQGLE
jgi:glucose-1-phosphate thymidylyltransferase